MKVKGEGEEEAKVEGQGQDKVKMKGEQRRGKNSTVHLHLSSSPSSLLSVSHLRIAFRIDGRESVPVRDVSFAIPKNGRVAIVGESGCGKSLTALSLGGLVDRAEISGEIVGSRAAGSSAPTDGRARSPSAPHGMPKIAYIFQNPMQSLNPVLRIEKQLREAIKRKEEVKSKSEEVWRGRHSTVHLHPSPSPSSLLSSVGLPPEAARKYPCQLSGGQQQRVMIAMALAAEPDLLIADEPTTALDVTTQKEVLELVDRVADERGMAVLLITHNLGLVAEHSHFVNVMYAGEIIECGCVADVLGSPIHPYTQGLIAAVPNLDAPKDAPLADIPGTVPPPTDWPSGCAFHPRCPKATEACKKAVSESCLRARLRRDVP